MAILDVDIVRDLFNIKDGVLVSSKTGKVVGRKHKTYWRVSVDGVRYPRARIVWLYHHGSFPSKQLGHIDGDGMNDDIDNLKQGYAFIHPSKRLHRRNSKGQPRKARRHKDINGHPYFRGVKFDSKDGTWKAFFRGKKEYKSLGSYSSYDLAVLARVVFEDERQQNKRVKYYEDERG